MKFGIAFPKPWSVPCILRKTDNIGQVSQQPDTTTEESSAASLVGGNDEATDERAQLYRELDGQTAHIQRLQTDIESLHQQLEETKTKVINLQTERDLIKNSKWLKLGQRLNRGPKLS